jgi:hypothetical protein
VKLQGEHRSREKQRNESDSNARLIDCEGIARLLNVRLLSVKRAQERLLNGKLLPGNGSSKIAVIERQLIVNLSAERLHDVLTGRSRLLLV